MINLLFEKVAFQYGEKTIFTNADFSLASGEAVCLLGANASGKTTLMSIAATLQSAGAGKIVWFEQPGTETAAIRKRMGYVPQEIALYQNMSPAENLRFFGRLYGIPGSVLPNRIAQACEVVGIDPQEKKKVMHLSGGMKRRVNIAVSLINEPELLIMDEPTAGIDMLSRRSIAEAVAALVKRGRTVLFSSHYPDEISLLANRVLLLRNGSISERAVNDASENSTESIYRMMFE